MDNWNDQEDIEEILENINLPYLLSVITMLGFMEYIFEEDGPYYILLVIGVSAIMNAISGVEMPFIDILITTFLFQYFYLIIA